MRGEGRKGEGGREGRRSKGGLKDSGEGGGYILLISFPFKFPTPYPGNLWFVQTIGCNVKCCNCTNHKFPGYRVERKRN